MAGVKGRSGGARPNTGGARPGAGRPKKEPDILVVAEAEDPEKFLRAVMNDSSADARLRIDAAKALMPYIHTKKGEGGKKDQQAELAKKVAGGKFAATAPPKLVVNNR